MLNIYAELVKGDYDVPGALAYAVYKRSKAEWRANFPNAHCGNEPTLADEAELSPSACSPKTWRI